jgi:hypothetical protein
LRHQDYRRTERLGPISVGLLTILSSARSRLVEMAQFPQGTPLALRRSVRFLAVVIAVTATLAAGCGGASPTAPDIPLSMGCAEELDGWRCTLSTAESAGVRDMTGLATWSTSDPGIATVNSVGFVTVLRTGGVAIRATYRGNDVALIIEVVAGAGRRYYRALSGWVTDAQTQEKLTDVAVEIVSGPNAGRTASTGTSGAYQLDDLDLGTFTLRFTRAGYLTADRTFTLTGDHYNSLDVTLTR